MRPAVTRILRTLQSSVPALRPLKFSTYNWATRALGWHVEPEFKLLSQLPPARLAIDIGGNWGQSIHALKRTARPEQIVSFEPNPVLADRLRSTFRRDPTVRIEAVGLGDAAGRFELHVPRYRSFVYDGLASLDRASAQDWLNAERMAWFDPDKLSIDQFEVEVRTLDSFKLSPDIVKIDVQGLELAVVKGGIETFRRSLPITIVEAPVDELVFLLGELGLEPYGYKAGKLVRGDRSGTNTVFVHRDRFAETELTPALG